MFQCSLCELKFINKVELDRHLCESHVPRIEFQCEQCNSIAETEESLNKHIGETHERKCSLCGEETLSKEDLEEHMESHTILVDHIISSMEKHLKIKCDYIQEKLDVERKAKDKVKEKTPN